MSHHFPAGEETDLLSLLLMILIDCPVCFPSREGRSADYFPNQKSQGLIVPFSTSDLTFSIRAFFLASAVTFPCHYLSQPLLKLTCSYFWISIVALTKVRQMYVDLFPPVVTRDGKCLCCPSWTKCQA